MLGTKLIEQADVPETSWRVTTGGCSGLEDVRWSCFPSVELWFQRPRNGQGSAVQYSLHFWCLRVPSDVFPTPSLTGALVSMPLAVPPCRLVCVPKIWCRGAIREELPLHSIRPLFVRSFRNPDFDFCASSNSSTYLTPASLLFSSLLNSFNLCWDSRCIRPSTSGPILAFCFSFTFTAAIMVNTTTVVTASVATAAVAVVGTFD